jgi:acetolactate synthase-1/2/3 large subunit
MGKGAIAETHDLALGTMGMLGQKVANQRIKAADLLLTVGTCLAPENTKMLSPDLINPERQRIVHIDIEPRNAGWTSPVTLGITSDAKLALRAIIDAARAKGAKIDVEGIEKLRRMKAEIGFFSSEASDSDESPVAPQRIVHELNRTMGPDDLLVLDAGNNRIWCANLFQSKRAGQVIGPGGAAGVGWGVPASLAAQMILQDRKVVGVSSDGGMMMMLYSLEMAKQYELPLTYVVMNNASLGNVRDYQPSDRKIASEYPAADFASIARAMGCEGFRIQKPQDLGPALREAMESDRPSVVDVVTSEESHFKIMA